MTGNELLKSMLCTTQTPDQTAAIACSKAGISPTADYYAGAVQTVQQACARKKPNSAAFWNAYQISLCNHLHQLEQDTQPDGQTTGKEAAPGRYPHRTGDSIRHCKNYTGYK